jgi:hypothetical protein
MWATIQYLQSAIHDRLHFAFITIVHNGIWNIQTLCKTLVYDIN